jgi:hypothetical protein
MLMGADLGVLPKNLTTPLRVAVAVALFAEVGGPPAFTAGWLDMQVTTVKAAIRVRLFVVIRTNFLPGRLGLEFSFFVARLRSQERSVVTPRSLSNHFGVNFLSRRFDIKRSAAVRKGTVNGTLQRLLDRWSTQGCERFWWIKETMMPEGSVGECSRLPFLKRRFWDCDHSTVGRIEDQHDSRGVLRVLRQLRVILFEQGFSGFQFALGGRRLSRPRRSFARK